MQKGIAPAPQRVRDLFNRHFSAAEIVPISDRALRLQSACLAAGVVTDNCLEDTLHVALAPIAGRGAIVSWTFRGIVHMKKIPLYNGVNMLNGPAPLAIYSPTEVIDYEEGT